MDTMPTAPNRATRRRRLLVGGAFAFSSVLVLGACGDDDEGNVDDGIENELEDVGDELQDLGDETGDAIDEETDEMNDDGNG